MARKLLLALSAVLVLGLLSYVWVSSAIGAQASCSGCNILIVTIDTLRADHVGSYGYPHNTTPFLDSLGERGILFENAVTSAPVTLPSHVSIMTGLYPFQHGVRDNGRFYLDESVTTLAEEFTDNGYLSAAFVSSFVLDSRFGLDQGFNTYDDTLTHPEGRIWREKWFNHTEILKYERKADNVTASAIDWLSVERDHPFFVWVHYFDPHEGYHPPREYEEMFDSEHPRYDGEIRYTDDHIRMLTEKISEIGELDDTLIVVVADHGQGLGDHGERLHGKYLYETTVHVPLIVVNPRLEGGKRVTEVVETVDIAPTIVESAGLDSEIRSYANSLYSLGNQPRTAYVETFMTGRRNPEKYKMALRGQDFKYVYDNKGDNMYFDLSRDSGEEKNVISSVNDSHYKGVLDDFVLKMSHITHAGGQPSLDEDALAALESLGYLI